jgi:putative N6-adenine-specific DNA methylase
LSETLDGNKREMPVTTETPLQKRIKRHVIGRKRQFFAATAPGLEPLCKAELTCLLPSETPLTMVEGGVEFQGRLHDCYLADLNLRTANRVLMRIASFHAANFRQLEKNLIAVPWELFLLPNPLIRVRVTSRHSRLYHKTAVAGRIQVSMVNRFTQGGFSLSPATDPVFTQQIFVRVSDNHFTLSIDSSGDLLHKRGIKPRSVKAPIRETLAAAALILAGYTGSEPLVDPMCGSGTFSIEAALTAQNIPSGWFRDFAFMQWPSFQAERWMHIKQEAQKNIVRINTPFIFASDQDDRTVRILEDSIAQHDLTGVITVSKRNFFDFSPKELTNQRGLVTLNPPYGRRMGSQSESGDLFLSVCDRLKKEYKGWKFALIAPNPNLAGMVPFKSRVHLLSHGGLKVVLMTGSIPDHR